ncbi:MAG: DUF1206 domain-containing protein [Prolixibacteraceae bacterium]
MEEKKEKIMRFGIASKGFVYCLIGGLTLLAAIGRGGSKSGSSDALKSLAGSTGGMILLGITALGLISYVFWRFYQTFKDPEEKGTGAKGIVIRIGYFGSGVLYGFLAYTALSILIGSGGGNGSGSGGGQETLIAKALNQSFGQILVAIIATIFLAKALYQMFRAYSGKYQKKVKEQNLSPKVKETVLTFGKLGYTARGIVVGVIAFLTYKAAFTASSDQAGGTKDAFNFVQNEFGSVILAVISVGLLMYGIFILVKARHREMSMI